MKVNVNYKSEINGVSVKLNCVRKGDYPSCQIFATDSVSENVEQLIKIYPVETCCVTEIYTKFFKTSDEATQWAKGVEAEIKAQYNLWKEKMIPEDYSFSIE